MTRADGILSAIDRTSALRMAEVALDERTREAEGAARSTSAARTLAVERRVTADVAAAAAESARDLAAATARAADDQAALVAGQRDALVARAAQLQGISTALATRRQAGLQARMLAGTQTAHAAQAADQGLDQGAGGDRAEAPVEPMPARPTSAAVVPAAPTPRVPVPPASPSVPAATPSAPATPATPAAPVAPVAPAAAPTVVGGTAAVALARQQLGEPYVWAAAGPDAWDCSGLTMAAWAAGGKTLPHCSVAQYEASTPIAPSALQPGDLVFWGSPGDPGSIYHVALYAGDDTIIHAPRTGRPVVEESIHYWRLPDFYARP